MFVKAYRVAAQWTRPVVVLERGPDGAVGTGCGTFIILNSEGWAATAAHILFAPPGAQLTDRCVWFTTDAIKGNFHIDLRADLAIGKLSGLDLSGIREYPKFGNGELTPGTSLSHWGFHSHATIKAAFDAQTRQFRVDSFPLIPLLPVAGMFTAPMLMGPTNNLSFAGPLDGGSGAKFLLTTAHILEGQSGGPVVDTEGHLWGLNNMGIRRYTGQKAEITDPRASAEDRAMHTPQFVNYSLAAHVENLIQLMSKHGVRMEENT